MITTEQIKTLRDKTGVSVMQCKEALERAGGDEEKALGFLREKGVEVSAKKQARTLGSGVVESYIHAGSKIGALVELLSETDFVARNGEFRMLAGDIAMHVAAMNPSGINDGEAALLAQPFVKDPGITVGALIEGSIQKFGEKIEVGRFTRYALLE